MKKKTKQIFIGIVILIGITFFLASTASNTKDSFTNLTKAQEDDPNFCQNACIGKDRCSQSSSSNPSDPNYNDPCCEELKKTGDPFACPWPQRGYCTDDQCSTIPEGVNRQRCGGPRHSWCNLCISHNCPGYGSNPVNPTSTPLSPTKTVISPTTQPSPTTVETPPEPTTIMRVPPNESPRPIITNTFQNAIPTSESQQFGFPSIPIKSGSIQFPSINLPKININLIEINQNARKPLDFFEYLFRRVVYYDTLLENTINQKMKSIIK